MLAPWCRPICRQGNRPMDAITPTIKGRALGTFGKGVPGAATLNFAPSGSANCSRRCAHRAYCYAERLERYRSASLGVGLARRSDNPAALCAKARRELAKRHNAPWLRVSAFGSVPMPGAASDTFLMALQDMLAHAKMRRIPVHFPVESRSKAAYYRRMVGPLATIRESATSHERFLSAEGPISAVAGRPGTTRAERLRAAKALAKRRAARSGRKCVVCPAVASPHNHKAKCGRCTVCARPDVDVVYPLH